MSFNVLLESRDALLLENGDNLQLEHQILDARASNARWITRPARRWITEPSSRRWILRGHGDV